MDLGEEDHVGKCHPHHILSRVHAMNMTYTADVDHGHLAEIIFARSLHC